MPDVLGEIVSDVGAKECESAKAVGFCCRSVGLLSMRASDEKRRKSGKECKV